jgi:nucleosome binding factor SPN SPT16 subunit
MSGTLEAHANGFRYSTMRQEEKVDIMYRNIKHAFFQPAEKEMITILHFHLHNYIMVGTKKTNNVQFYVEVMEAVQTLGGNRRSMMDPDEIEEEQQERDRRNKINKEFEVFVKRMAELWDQPPWRELDLEFDIPFRELGFHGVPNKSSAFIVPTVNCLVELIETPFLVVSLNDIEIVNLERVGLGQKAFDMAIVFKDFKRDILRIDAIPSTSLDGIKEWLNSMNIKYYESRMNLNWRPILKTILEVDLPIISVHF